MSDEARQGCPFKTSGMKFTDSQIAEAVELYGRVLDDERGGTGAYLYIGSETALRAVLEFLVPYAASGVRDRGKK